MKVESTREPDFDVIVCGYGPTGQAAASLLAGRGHRVAVFERWPSLYGLPRLCSLDAEGARVVQAAGDVDIALRDSGPVRRLLHVNEADELLIDISFEKDHPCGFPTRIAMHQPDVEDAMDGTARRRGVVVRQGWELTGLTQDGDAVTVTARERAATGEDPDLGRTEQLRARYVIAADGARSTTRRLLGIPSENCGFSSAWLSVDALRRRPLPTIHHSPDLRIPLVVMAPEGRSRAIIPIGAQRLRFEFWVDPALDHQEKLDFEVGYEAMKQAYGLTPDDVEIFRTVIYPFRSEIATSWRQGRVFIAGDAAHLMTPFLGQGACSGLRDAVNLAWKLDLVLRGLGPDQLLDTYEQEREPHVRTHVLQSSELGAMSLEPDPVRAAGRDAMLRAGAPPPPPDPVVTSGVLHRDGNGDVVPPVGALAPQGRVRHGDRHGRFDDIFGWGFHVIARDRDPATVLSEDQLLFLRSIGAVVVGVTADPGTAGADVVLDEEGRYGAYLDAHGFAAIVARPDFVLFGGARTSQDLPGLIDELRRLLGGG